MTEKDNFYLNRYAFAGKCIDTIPSKKLGIVVVIPCFNEPDVLPSLESLRQAHHPNEAVEVIIVINNAETATEEIKDHSKETLSIIQEWARIHNSEYFKVYPLLFDALPGKHAGVGLARKIGMDEAVRRFILAEKEDGIIICFDADSLCEPNYFQEIEKQFLLQQSKEAFGIYFEHPLKGEDHSPEIYHSIMLYELHLRYYIDALKWSGLPSAYQTIGSSMAVRASAYQKEGGMNKKKAGEDFYFLQKFIDKGRFGEIKTTKVIPSPRISDRVPFGTGKAVSDHILEHKSPSTYNYKTFQDLKIFLDRVDSFYTEDENSIHENLKHLPVSIAGFLKEHNFETALAETKKQSKTLKTFNNRFFRWFNAFMAMKFVHYSRDHFYLNEAVEKAATEFLSIQMKVTPKDLNPKMLLKKFREIDLIN